MEHVPVYPIDETILKVNKVGNESFRVFFLLLSFVLVLEPMGCCKSCWYFVMKCWTILEL